MVEYLKNLAQLFGDGFSERGVLKKGAPADIVLYAPEESWTVDPARFQSRSRNTPLVGWVLPGRIRRTIVSGETRFEAEGDA